MGIDGILLHPLAGTAVMVGDLSLSAARLYSPARDTFSESGLFSQTLRFDPARETYLMCVGDSNMRGGVEKDVISPAQYFAEIAKTKGWAPVTVDNRAMLGANAKEMLTQLEEDVWLGPNNKAMDIWVNISGNQFKGKVSNQLDAENLAEIAKSPHSNLAKFIDFGLETLSELPNYGRDIYRLLQHIEQRFAHFPIRNLVIWSGLDYSEAPILYTGHLGIGPQELPTDHPLIHPLIKKASIELNNQAMIAAQRFAQHSLSQRVVAVNLMDLGRFCFRHDEHLNEYGKKIWAQRAIIKYEQAAAA